MSLLRIKNGIEKLPDAKLIEKGYLIHQQVSTRTSVFATPSPTMTVLKDALDELQSAVNNASNRDRIMVEQKAMARQVVVDLLHSLGYYVLFAANGNRLVALESGFTIAKDPVPIIMVKPSDLKADYGTQQGEMLVSVKKVKGAAAYVHQYSTDPLLKEESWTSVNSTTSKSKIGGLTPGTTYFLRVGAIGAKDQVLFSNVVSKMAA